MSETKPPKPPKLQRIDVHHHPVLASHLSYMGRNSANPAAIRNWTIAKSLDDMDRAGIGKAMLSLPYPPEIWATDAVEAATIAREGNEFMAQLARDHGGRFGVFATLPINHIDNSLAEIDYAFDTLKVDGIGLMTNLGERWLGDPHYAPLFEVLNKRETAVFVHPAAPFCCTNLVPDIPDTMIEFATDTTRAIANMVFGGTSRRCPDLRVIWSHAGGTMPFLIYRFLKTAGIPVNAQKLPQGVVHELKRFYYDTAQASHPVLLTALKQVVGLEHTVFGSDYPWGLAPNCVAELEAAGVLSADEMRGIDYANILPLLPRFQ